MATKTTPQQAPRGTSVYEHLRERLRAELVAPGKPGERVPGEKTLATQFGVSPVTMSRALQELQNEGVILRVPGKGTFLAETLENGGQERIISAPIQQVNTPWNPLLAEKESAPPLAIRAIIMAPLGVDDLSFLYGNWEPRMVSRLEQLIQGAGGITTTINRDMVPFGQDAITLESLRESETNMVFLIPDVDLPGENLIASLQRLQHAGTDLVITGLAMGSKGEESIDTIGFDGPYGAFLIGQHLRELNHRRIAYVVPDEPMDFVLPRLKALRNAIYGSKGASVEEVRVAVPDDTTRQMERNLESRHLPTPDHDIWISCGEYAASELNLEEQYSALVFGTDNMARGYIMKRRQMGLEIKASVVGYDDRNYGSSLGLTTVHPPLEEMADYAFRLANSRLRQPFEAGCFNVSLKPTLIKRSSTRPASD